MCLHRDGLESPSNDDRTQAAETVWKGKTWIAADQQEATVPSWHVPRLEYPPHVLNGASV